MGWAGGRWTRSGVGAMLLVVVVVAVTACGVVWTAGVGEPTVVAGSGVGGTVPEPTVPDAPWSVPPVAGPASVATLSAWWQEWIGDEYGCPLLAPVADPSEFGASGPPADPLIGSAGGGPWIDWPGETAPSLYVHLPPLDANMTSDYFGPDASVVLYADGSEERSSGEGRSLVLLPEVGCGYEFDLSRAAQVESTNFFHSLRIIAPEPAVHPDAVSTSTTTVVDEVDEATANRARCSLQFGTAVQMFAESQDFTWLTDTWGANSPLFRIGIDLGTQYLETQWQQGTDAAGQELAAAVTDLCRDPAFHNEVMQVQPGDPWYIDPNTSAQPTPSQAAATGEPMVVTAASYGGFDFGETWDEGGLPLGLPNTFGPRPAGICTNPDLEVIIPDVAVSFGLDPDGRLFGFYASATTSGPVRPGQPIDLAGTGLGWGATVEEIEQAFPHSSRDPLLGDMIIQLDDGLLHLYFTDGQLDTLRAGDDCSLGGVVNVGDT